METQKIVNLLNGSDNENVKFATKNGMLLTVSQKVIISKDDPITFLTWSIESSLCDYSDPYVLVKENIDVGGGDDNTKVAFKNCAPFRKCRREVNETFIDEAEDINTTMPMCNLIEYSDNYSDTSGSLWQFIRDE